MRIQNNVMAINTHRQYNTALGGVSKSAEKLSSGYRINRAGDDAAGLAISEKMRAQIRGLDMASKNSQDAISLVQTAEGALQETHNILQRMRELSVQSASDTNEQSVDRAALEAEFTQLRDEINDIASKTRFNDQNLIDGTFQKYTRSINANGTTANFMSSINSMNVAPAKAGDYVMSVSLTTYTAQTVSQGTAVSGTFYAPGSTVGSIIAGSGTAVNAAGVFSGLTFAGVETDVHNGNVYQLKIEGGDMDDLSFSLIDSHGNTVSRTDGIDGSNWSSTGGTYTVTFEGVGSMKFNINAAALGTNDLTVSELQKANTTQIAMKDGKNQTVVNEVMGRLDLTMNGETVSVEKGDTTVNFRSQGISFEFDALSDSMFTATATAFGVTTGNSVTISVNQIKGADMIIQTGANEGDETGINIDAMNANTLGITFSSIATRANASKAIEEVNRAINTVSTQRAKLGALQNRLEYKINNLDTSSENLTASESRIRDVDMAKEMTNFTKRNILVQAATSMLAQANTSPQNVLSLLG